MHSLESTQKIFQQSILQQDLVDTSFIKSSYPTERLSIYRQTILENITNSLKITFPGIWKLLGDECAYSAVYAFCKHKQNLPISGCLDDFGEKFPQFLEAQKEFNALPYLKDYGRFEWLQHQSYRAKHLPSISTSELEMISDDIIEETGFSLIPSAFTFTAEFPIDQIQKIIEDPSAKPINLTSKKVYAVIARPGLKVLILWITEELWQFINLLTQGFNFIEITQKIDKLNLTEAICFMLQNQLICEINIKGKKPL